MKKILAFALILILCTGFMAVVLHHHEDGMDHHDCGVCYLAHAITAFIVLASLLVAMLFSSKQFFRVISDKFNSLDLISGLKGRAPPVLA